MGVRLQVRSPRATGDGEEVVYEFDQDRILIGRGRGADVCLPSRTVSIRHATIELSARGYTLLDHDSTNGTRVSGALLVPGRAKTLRDGDRIDVGGFILVFRSGVAVTAPTSSERTASLARSLARGASEPGEDELRPVITIANGPRKGARFPLPDAPSRIVVGRDEVCEVSVPDADASREHAEVLVTVDGVRVRDLGSKNGIVVGGRSIRDRLLADREELQVGATVLVFEDPAGDKVRELEQGDDAPYEPPPEPEPELEPEPEPEELPSEPLEEVAPKRASIAPADMLIYVLASVVFAVSLLGLAWLLRG